MIPIKMSTLQDLAMKHVLPAVVIRPLSKDTMGKDLKDRLVKLNSGTGNDDLYNMFAQSMEARGDVSTFPFSSSSSVILIVCALLI